MVGKDGICAKIRGYYGSGIVNFFVKFTSENSKQKTLRKLKVHKHWSFIFYSDNKTSDTYVDYNNLSKQTSTVLVSSFNTFYRLESITV